VGVRLGRGGKPAVFDGFYGKVLFELDDQPLAIDSAAQWIACRKRDATGRGTLTLIDLADGSTRWTGWNDSQNLGDSLDLKECRFSSYGQWLAWKAVDTKSRRVTVGLSDTKTGKAIQLSGDTLPLDISPSGERLLTASGICAPDRPDIVLPLTAVSALWSPDGRRCAIFDGKRLQVLYAPNDSESLEDKDDNPASLRKEPDLTPIATSSPDAQEPNPP
jgi:hypothetical protein